MAVRQFSPQERRERRTKIKFNTPYKEAVDKFRRYALARADYDYDPANLAVFSFMMSRAVIEMLKAVEKAYGEEGHQVVAEAMRKVAREATEQALDGVEIPQDLTEIELRSIWGTFVNEVLWASVEEQRIVSEDETINDILWCPIGDIYSAMDCRVQRYFVEGMNQAAGAEKFRKGNWRTTFPFDGLITQGYSSCHSRSRRIRPGEEGKTWEEDWKEYTKVINARGLNKSQEGQ